MVGVGMGSREVVVEVSVGLSVVRFGVVVANSVGASVDEGKVAEDGSSDVGGELNVVKDDWLDNEVLWSVEEAGGVAVDDELPASIEDSNVTVEDKLPWLVEEANGVTVDGKLPSSVEEVSSVSIDDEVP